MGERPADPGRRVMDLTPTARSLELRARLLEFMDEFVYPAERVYWQQRASGDPHAPPPVLEELKTEARSRGLWNLFLPDGEWGAGLSNVEYASLAEITGRSPHFAPEAINCSAPDTGNMEVLAQFGSDEQRRRWLVPLLDGEIRSCFAMTEPGVASSDPTNLATTIRRDGDAYVVNGRKWWSTGALDPRCRVAIVMGVSDPDAAPHARHSMVLVPLDAPGVKIERDLTTFGYTDRQGHGELVFDGVRVPAANLIGERGAGFAIAQARLGPGRIHHCMRTIGTAERSLQLMTERAIAREAFGVPLSEHGVVSTWIAESRIELEQARLLTLKAAWLMDTVGNKSARSEIAAIKVVAARVGTRITDRAMQVFGAAGLSGDTPLAYFYAMGRQLRIADGPDEVHLRTVAREEIRTVRQAARPAA
ncbi:MAG TPA: acyl-CoA dehydrogenase family protein [Thermoleophilaceae bacterium]|nr:acyl-CoA dehydrogenase family protein [Thermoleophilaceae bacterium]